MNLKTALNTLGSWGELLSIEEYLERDPEADESALRYWCARANDGELCENCGQPIWALGSAKVGWPGCHTCITGEASVRHDIEVL